MRKSLNMIAALAVLTGGLSTSAAANGPGSGGNPGVHGTVDYFCGFRPDQFFFVHWLPCFVMAGNEQG